MFKLSAWCRKPDSINPSQVIHVVEPSTGSIAPPGKPTLTYPFSFLISLLPIFGA